MMIARTKAEVKDEFAEVVRSNKEYYQFVNGDYERQRNICDNFRDALCRLHSKYWAEDCEIVIELLLEAMAMGDKMDKQLRKYREAE